MVLLLQGCGSSAVVPPTQRQVHELEVLSGGDTTHFTFNANAFNLRAANLTTDQAITFERGDTAFEASWQIAPHAVSNRDGLGPLFNARSCVACHQADGRGRPPIDDETHSESLLFRLSRSAPELEITRHHAEPLLYARTTSCRFLLVLVVCRASQLLTATSLAHGGPNAQVVENGNLRIRYQS